MIPPRDIRHASEVKADAVAPPRGTGAGDERSSVGTPLPHRRSVVRFPIRRPEARPSEKVAFVERKTPDMARVARLLEQCGQANQWANRGPLYRRLTEVYAEHLGIGPERALTPCANGAVALEAMARLLALRAGRKLRWVGSAFSFRNLGRGYFSDMTFVDCDVDGLLDLDALRELDDDSYDAIVLVNPFGLHRNFPEHVAHASRLGKRLLIDNAAGLGARIPDWPWQSFSLHHTKPYGVGEGGLALTPNALSDDLYRLLNYDAAPSDAACWLGNGKLSDIACAFHIDRLERSGEWLPAYERQARRVETLASRSGLTPLCPLGDASPATSRPYRSTAPLPLDNLALTRHLTLGKYYQPLADLPRTLDLHRHLVNIPVHPDVASIGDDDLTADLAALHPPARRRAIGR